MTFGRKLVAPSLFFFVGCGQPPGEGPPLVGKESAVLARAHVVDALPLDETVPRRTSAPLVIAHSGDAWLEIEALDVPDVAGKDTEGLRTFATPSFDLVLARVAGGLEELRVVHEASGPRVFRYRLRHGPGIAALRVRAGAIEAIDRAGLVRVRAAQPLAWDARGVERALDVELHDGVLTLTLDVAGLSHPIVVDPKWTTGTLPSSFYNHVAVALPSGKVLLAGPLKKAALLDPTDGTAVPLPDTTADHADGAAVLLATGQALVTGGGAGHATTELFDGKAWKSVASMKQARRRHLATVLGDGRVLVVGGQDGTTSLSSAEAYDRATDAWTTLTPASVAHDQGALAVLKDGRVLVTGGIGAGLTVGEIFDPKTNTWTKTAPTPTARTRFSLVTLLDGKVLAVGGATTAATDVYEPLTDKWSTTGAASAARIDAQAARLPDGKVLLSGGTLLAGGTALTTAELYDPKTGTFSDAPPMSKGRAGHRVAMVGARYVASGGTTGTAANNVDVFLPDPAKCTTKDECGSGQCVDGYCCDTACTGSCTACNLPGLEGICAGVADGTTDPKGTCTKGACGLGCRGGACAYEPDTKVCGAATCKDGVRTAARCSGTSATCGAAIAEVCPGGVACADATSCRSKCVSDSDCEGGGACNATLGTCSGGKGKPLVTSKDFVRCKDKSECTSGFCVEGVCCDQACDKPCHSCALLANPGHCTKEGAGVDLKGDCSSAGACTGTCGADGACVGAVAGSMCARSTCTGPSQGTGATYCAAAGAPCPAAVPFDCAPYACVASLGACKDSCSTSADCALGYACDGTSRVCVPSGAGPAESDGGCATSPGSTRGGAVALLALAALGRVRRRRPRA